jgi:hypothetical protein
MSKTALLLLIIFSSIYSRAQYRAVNDKNNRANEPSIAISKKDPKVVVAASNLNWIYHSEDGGNSWNSYKLGSSLGFYGDPVLHAAANGDFYLVHLSATKGKKWGDWFDRIVFQKSSDGGKTFTDGTGIGYNLGRTQDKPWLSTDATGNLYLTWTEFDKYGSDSAHHYSKIMFSKSEDGGVAWSKPIIISDDFGGCVDDDNTLEGATSAVNSEGEIVVTWAGKEKIFLDRSKDGGKTFGEDIIILNQKGGWVLDIPHLHRSNGMPFLHIDRSNGASHNNLYLILTSKNEKRNEVVLYKSTNDGISWTQLNGFASKLSGHQFFPNLTVDPQSGSMIVGFYDAPSDYSYNYANYHKSISIDGGKTFTNTKLTKSPFPLPRKEVFFGDYSDVDYTDGNEAAVFVIYSPALKNVEEALHVIAYTGAKKANQAALLPNHIQREGYMSFLLPPNSKIKIKIKQSTNKASTNFMSLHFVNPSNQDWKEQKWNMKGIESATIKYKVKQKVDGRIFPKKTRRKTFYSSKVNRLKIS